MIQRRNILGTKTGTVISTGFLVSMILFYLYFLNMSVAQVVMRTELNQQKQLLHNEIAKLEAVYIESQHTIASRLATLEGYQLDSDKIFVSRGETDTFVLGR